MIGVTLCQDRKENRLLAINFNLVHEMDTVSWQFGPNLEVAQSTRHCLPMEGQFFRHFETTKSAGNLLMSDSACWQWLCKGTGHVYTPSFQPSQGSTPESTQVAICHLP